MFEDQFLDIGVRGFNRMSELLQPLMKKANIRNTTTCQNMHKYNISSLFVYKVSSGHLQMLSTTSVIHINFFDLKDSFLVSFKEFTQYRDLPTCLLPLTFIREKTILESQ